MYHKIAKISYQNVYRSMLRNELQLSSYWIIRGWGEYRELVFVIQAMIIRFRLRLLMN